MSAEARTSDRGDVDWTAAKRVFAAALDLPDEERNAFVATELAGDTPTHRRVASLLEAHGRTNGFLVEPKRVEDAIPTLPGRIGSYTPIERLGEGGFGVVYRAKQLEPIERDVALKVLRPGFNTPDMIARFRDEPQYLAKLDHSDIVKIFDAGVTDDGAVYLVMEHVEGEPVTAYAEGVPTSERLRLIVRICRAVHAVHQRGVIHRDLKPSNILVRRDAGDEDVQLRVIDFGIAAAVERSEREGVTAVGAPLGTPRYASPEQIRGDAGIDTRTDVFALGMILCEILTGKLPRKSGASEETSAEKPSVLHPEDRSTLRGDIDRIVLKAIAWEREQRYDSAAALADDLERYLRGEPVLATRPSALYTTRKFIARKRGVTALIAAATVALVGGVVALAIGIERAREAEREVRDALAEVTAERDRADAINSFLLGDVIDAMNPERTGEPVPRTDELLARMSELGDESFADEPATAHALLARVGDAQRSLGLFGPARASRERAVEAATRAYGPTDARTIAVRLDTMLVTSANEELHAKLHELARTARTELGLDHPLTLRTDIYALASRGAGAKAEEVFELIERIESSGMGRTPLHVEALEQLRTVLSEQDDPRGIDMLLQAVELSRNVHGPLSSITLEIIGRAGSALRQAGRSDDALALLGSAYEHAERVYGPQQHLTKMLLNRLAVASLLGGRPEEGLRLGEDLHARATAPGHEDAYFASIGAMLIARGYEELDRHTDAVPWRRERLARMRTASDDVNEHHVPRARLVLTLARAGMLDEAAQEFGAIQEAGGPLDDFRFSAAVVLARGLDGVGRTDEAIALLRDELAEQGYAPETAERFDSWIQRLNDNSDAR